MSYLARLLTFSQPVMTSGNESHVLPHTVTALGGNTRRRFHDEAVVAGLQGHVVMAVEHADGTASAVHLAGQGAGPTTSSPQTSIISVSVYPLHLTLIQTASERQRCLRSSVKGSRKSAVSCVRLMMV